MQYPTLEEAERADLLTLCRWHRFLPSPGSSAIKEDVPYAEFKKVMEAEVAILVRIQDRLGKMDGFTPQISKALGSDPPG
jgi:hypothetical protein